MASQTYDLISVYKLVHQHWLIKDVNQRHNMTNGVGPMGLVKNRMSSAQWFGKRSIKMPDEWDSYRSVLNKGAETEEDGILAFPTAQL